MLIVLESAFVDVLFSPFSVFQGAMIEILSFLSS